MFAAGLLLLAYALTASFFYRANLEEYLSANAQDLLSNTPGLEGVDVSFTELDARLSGTVSSKSLKEKAARLIAGLPSVTIASNSIGVEEIPAPQDKTDSVHSTAKQERPLPPEPPPPKPNPSTLTMVIDNGTTVLTGTVTSLARKKELVTPFALAGGFFDLESNRLQIDPDIQPDDWPESLPRFLALIATRSKTARLILTNTKFDLAVSALDERSAQQLEQLAQSLKFPGRQRTIMVDIQSFPKKPSKGFFLFAQMNSKGDRLRFEGRLASHKEKDSLIEIVTTDLAIFGFAEQIEIESLSEQNGSQPEYISRLPNILSLVYSRAAVASIFADTDQVYVVGEMKPGLNSADLRDLLKIMIGTRTHLHTDLLPNAQDFVSIARPDHSPSSTSAQNKSPLSPANGDRSIVDQTSEPARSDKGPPKAPLPNKE